MTLRLVLLPARDNPNDTGPTLPMNIERISAILENRPAHVSARVAANWTMAGYMAHQSAMRGGEILDMPDWAIF